MSVSYDAGYVYRPTDADFRQLAAEVGAYIGVFADRSPVPEQESVVRKIREASKKPTRARLRQRNGSRSGKLRPIKTMSEKYETERTEKEQRLVVLEQSGQESAKKQVDIQSWMRLIGENAKVEIVDRELLESLVEKIEIGEREVIDGEKRQDIRIYYEFVGLL